MKRTKAPKVKINLFQINAPFFKEFFKKGKLWILFYVLVYLFSFPAKYIQVVGSKNFLDSVTEKNDLLQGMIWIILLLFVPQLDFLFNNLTMTYQQRIFQKIKPEIKRRIVRQMDHRYLSYFDDPVRQDQITRALAYMDNGGQSLFSFIISTLGFISSLFTLSFVSFQVDWWLILGAILVFLIQNFIAKFVREWDFEFQKQDTVFTRQLGYYGAIPSKKEYIAENRLFHSTDYFIDKFQVFNDIRTERQGRHSINRNFWTLFQKFPQQLLLLMLYYIMGVRLMKKTCTIGDYALFFSMVGQINSLLGQIRSIISSYQQQKLDASNYIEFSSNPQEMMPKIKVPLLLRRINSIEFERVTFSYPGQQVPALRDVSTKIRRGEKIAIVGYNGAGKSTFLKLLLNLYAPHMGEIRINGHLVSQIHPRSLWRKMGVVLQNNHIYSLTLGENILLNPAELKDEDAIWSALKKVGLKEKIEKTADALETPVTRAFDPAGLNFSGGESQKLSIARAIIRKCDFLVLDEPSSALDPVAEEELYQCIEKVSENRTVIMISHRLSSVKFADRVIFFKNGTILGDARHDQLMESCEEYRSIFLLQAKRYQE